VHFSIFGIQYIIDCLFLKFDNKYLKPDRCFPISWFYYKAILSVVWEGI